MTWDKETTGQRLKRLRELRRLSQQELGGRTDLSERSINRIEKDVSPLLKEDRVRIALALGVTEDYLLNGDSHAERETVRLIDELKSELVITSDEELRLKELAYGSIRQRKNARVPLNSVDLKALLEVIRGS